MNVCVVGYDMSVPRMFEKRGFSVNHQVHKDVDLICFTGGEDVSPCLYGEKQHPATYHNLQRDFKEIPYFEYGLNNSIPMVGICRGGQFLNVMSGGKMYQDVDGHAMHGTHRASRLDVDQAEYINVTSTHHQMMKPSEEGIVLLIGDTVGEVRTYDEKARICGVEAVLYPRTRSLCFQPHPEYGAVSIETEALFFEYISKYFGLKGGE